MTHTRKVGHELPGPGDTGFLDCSSRSSGQGHAWGLQRHSEFAQRFGLVWVNGNFMPGTRLTDPNYYGHWRYIHSLNPLPANNPDFFQVIDYAMNQANGGIPDPNHVRNTFNVGAALIDQYDTDDLYDPDPNPPANGNAGNTITIIDSMAGTPQTTSTG